MKESFSLKRLSNLFQWQLKKMKPFVFIALGFVVFVYSYFNTMHHYTTPDSFSGKLVFYVVVIAICTNFFKQLTKNENASSFILLPSSTKEKFVFLLSSVVLIPMLLIVALIEVADLTARNIHLVPENYQFMDVNSYLTILMVASIVFFTHCLPRKGWSLGLSLIFLSFLIPIAIGYYKRKEVIVPIISEILSAINQPLILVVFSIVVIYLAYVFFKRNEVSNFKVYE